MRVLLGLALVAVVWAAPAPEPKEIDKRRESTKETIELEDTLKQLAGEDKKFFTNPLAQPVPQIDGLEEKGAHAADDTAVKAAAPPVVTSDSGHLAVVAAEPAAVAAGAAQSDPGNKAETVEEVAQNRGDQKDLLSGVATGQGTAGDDEEEEEEEDEAALNEPLNEADIGVAGNQALEDEIEAAQHPPMPVPGPYGPGLETSFPAGSASVEYEPAYTGSPEDEDEDELEEELEGEDMILERIRDTLRQHPELLREFLIANQGNEFESNEPIESSKRSQNIDLDEFASFADYEDQMSAIQAELAAIRAQTDPQFAASHYPRAREHGQNYIGDKESHIVAKKQSLGHQRVAIPKEYMEDSIESYNRYFDTFAGDEDVQQVDIPIM